MQLPTPSKDRVARSPHVSLSPYASVSPQLESPKRPYRSDSEEVSEDEEIPIVSATKLSNSSKDKEQLSLKKPFQSDDEESSEDASIASHLSNRSKQNEVVPQRGHQGPSYDSERRPMAMQLPSRSGQQEEEESGTEEEVVDSENDEGPPWSEMRKQHVSKQKEHPAPRRTYRTSIERQHSQRNLPVSPRQHHNVSYDNAERRASLNDGSEYAPRRLKTQTLNDEEQIAPKIRHPPTRRHQSSSDEREKILRITQSPPRRDGRSQRREGRGGTSQSSLRRGERYAEESERRGRNLVQSPPRTPRRSDMSPEEREQRRGAAVSPPRRNQRLREEREERESIRGSHSRRKQRVPDDREHRRRPVYDSSERGEESSSDEREYVSRGGRSPPRREARFNERGDSRRKVQSPPREEDHEDTTINPWARQPTPIVNHISFDDSRVSSRRSSSRMSSQISSDVRRIFFAVADDDGESAGVDDGDWGSFLFEGKTLEDLKEALQEQTGIYEDIFVCVRSPLSGKLNMLKQNLPPTNSPLQVELVIVNSTGRPSLPLSHIPSCCESFFLSSNSNHNFCVKILLNQFCTRLCSWKKPGKTAKRSNEVQHRE